MMAGERSGKDVRKQNTLAPLLVQTVIIDLQS
jgi:hypothetical protein